MNRPIRWLFQFWMHRFTYNSCKDVDPKWPDRQYQDPDPKRPLVQVRSGTESEIIVLDPQLWNHHWRLGLVPDKSSCITCSPNQSILTNQSIEHPLQLAARICTHKPTNNNNNKKTISHKDPDPKWLLVSVWIRIPAALRVESCLDLDLK
jgi:hypothetical protein